MCQPKMAGLAFKMLSARHRPCSFTAQSYPRTDMPTTSAKWLARICFICCTACALARAGEFDFWVVRNSGVGNPLRAICYGGNRFVAVGQNAILFSSNAIQWTLGP